MPTENKKFIIDVVPLTKIAPSRQQFFSYLHDQELPIGTLVSIPFFRRNLEGIVIDSRGDFQHVGNFELKRLSRVLQENFLTEKQIALAEMISAYYVSSLGIILKAFVPQVVKERNTGDQSQVITHEPKNITLTPQQQLAVSAIADNYSKFKIQNSKFLLYGPASSGKTEVYIKTILELVKKNPAAQFLILLPELNLIIQALERYGQHFLTSEISVLHSKLGKGEFYTNWQKIQSGQARIIIGTRMAVFAPFENLELIVIDEEQDISFKQWDSNPRYDARTVSELVAKIHACPLVVGSATPRIETYAKALEGEYKLLSLPYLDLGSKKITKPKIEIMDMRKEKWTDFSGKRKANNSCISRGLQAEITYALSHRLQTVLFINHQGMNAFSVCAECKTVLRCQKCERALVYDNQGEYKCLHCTYASGIFPTCNKCGSGIFKNIGVGTQMVQREIHKLFPSARILRADGTTIKKPTDQEKVYQDFKSGACDILIGTQMITKGWDLPNVALVGIIDADTLLTMPDFYTDERAFQHMVQTAGRTGRLGSRYPGVAIFQTHEPNNAIIKLAAEMNYEAFYAREIVQREELSYPPHGKIIKLLFQDTKIEKVEKETQKIYTELLRVLENITDIKLSGPHEPVVANVRGRRKKQLIIKIKGRDAVIPTPLLKVMQKLGTGWTIDVDPISIA